MPWDSIDRRRDEDELPRPLQMPTTRELEVLQMLANVGTAKRVAAALRLSEYTVRDHMGRLLRKLGARNAAQAVAIGMRCRLIR